MTWQRAVRWIFSALAALWVLGGVVIVAVSATRPAKAAEACGPPPWPPLGQPVVKLEPGDVRALAEVIYGEGRGDGWCGMIGIGSVVVNRLRADPKRWGATVAQVVNSPNQFSSFGRADPNLKRMKRADESEPAFFLSTLAALAVLGGAPDPTGSAVYFHHRNMVPVWAPGTVITARIGSHVYRKAK